MSLVTYEALHEEQSVYIRSFIATSLPSRSLRSNRGITLSVPRIRTNTGARAFGSCAPPCPFSHLGCHLQKTSQSIHFWFGLPSVDTDVSNGLLMLRNSLNDFVFEHQFRCCATEPGNARDIGAIEIWLIDWLIDWCSSVLNSPDTRKVLQNLTCVTSDQVTCLVMLAP